MLHTGQIGDPTTVAIMQERVQGFPAGASVTQAQLDEHLHETLAELRTTEPVSWVPALGAWLVTSRELAVSVMRDDSTFTVDDPRFSTAQVLGPSMLSLDGAEHARHRDPFAGSFRIPEVRRRFTDSVHTLAHEVVGGLAAKRRAELRREIAGPLAVRVMAVALDLVDGDPATLLAWYDQIVAAVAQASTGQVFGPELVPAAVADLARSVERTIAAGDGVLAAAADSLTVDEIVSNTGVLLFGGIETSEGMTTNVFTHLLAEPVHWSTVAEDQALVANAVEESLRLEPAVVRVDRFATRDTHLGGAHVVAGDFVIVAISAANRDPATFADPDRFDPRRSNARQHLTFVQGPHTCLGMHLARVEAQAAVIAALDLLPGLRLDPERPPPEPSGTVFRKPDRLDVVWEV
jgi:cytochrome P450